MLDNPCLSRNLIADYPNNQCYKQTSTNPIRYLRWKQVYSNCDEQSCWGTSSWVGREVARNYLTPVDLWIIYGNASMYFYQNDWLDGQNQVQLYRIDYTCPTTHPTKLSDSLCEYREPF